MLNWCEQYWQEKAAVVLDTSHPMYQLILQQYTQIANEDGQYYEYMYWCQQMMSMKLHSPHALCLCSLRDHFAIEGTKFY